jgi:hypothetical protein
MGTRKRKNHVRPPKGPVDVPPVLDSLVGWLNDRDEFLKTWQKYRPLDTQLAQAEQVRGGHWTTNAAAILLRMAPSYGAACAGAAVIAPSLPLKAKGELARETITRFRRVRDVHPPRLDLVPFHVYGEGDAEVHFTAAGYGDDIYGMLVAWVWEMLRSPHRDRFKRCRRCATWFVDRTKSKRMVWCSQACHDAAWTRAQRRAAAHDQYRRPRRGRRGGKR